MDVRAIRARFGSQTALGQELGVSQQAVSRYERTGRIPEPIRKLLQQLEDDVTAATVDGVDRFTPSGAATPGVGNPIDISNGPVPQASASCAKGEG